MPRGSWQRLQPGYDLRPKRLPAVPASLRGGMSRGERNSWSTWGLLSLGESAVPAETRHLGRLLAGASRSENCMMR